MSIHTVAAATCGNSRGILGDSETMHRLERSYSLQEFALKGREPPLQYIRRKLGR